MNEWLKSVSQNQGSTSPTAFRWIEVEIEIEIADGFIDIVSVMTSPDRSLKQARELKESWREGQQIPEQAGYSPHPIAAEATHAEADLPNVPPVGSSLASADDGSKNASPIANPEDLDDDKIAEEKEAALGRGVRSHRYPPGITRLPNLRQVPVRRPR